MHMQMIYYYYYYYYYYCCCCCSIYFYIEQYYYDAPLKYSSSEYWTKSLITLYFSTVNHQPKYHNRCSRSLLFRLEHEWNNHAEPSLTNVWYKEQIVSVLCVSHGGMCFRVCGCSQSSTARKPRLWGHMQNTPSWIQQHLCQTWTFRDNSLRSGFRHCDMCLSVGVWKHLFLSLSLSLHSNVTFHI